MVWVPLRLKKTEFRSCSCRFGSIQFLQYISSSLVIRVYQKYFLIDVDSAFHVVVTDIICIQVIVTLYYVVVQLLVAVLGKHLFDSLFERCLSYTGYFAVTCSCLAEERSL